MKNGIPDCILFRTPFAFLDYAKPAALVFAENLAVLTAFGFLGAACALLMKKRGGKKGGERL